MGGGEGGGARPPWPPLMFSACGFASSPFIFLHSAGCDDVQALHVVCYLSQDSSQSTATIECLRNNNLNFTTCAVNGSDEQLCTQPLEYSGWTLGYGSHFVDIEFTDECDQVEIKRVYFDLIEPRNMYPGILKMEMSECDINLMSFQAKVTRIIIAIR